MLALFRVSIVALCLSIGLGPAFAGSMMTMGAGGPKVAAGGCSQATAFLARTSGLSGTETTAYTNLICGLVTDGVYSSLDALYIFATNTTTTAKLNLISTSFPLTYHGTPAESSQFSADHGYTGDGSTVYLDTGLIPNAGGTNFTQNAASFGVYDLTARTSLDSSAAIGTSISFSNSGNVVAHLLYSGLGAGQSGFSINNDVSSITSEVTASSAGNYIVSRTSSSVGAVYRNGSSLGSISSTTTGIADNSITILAQNSFGAPNSFATDQASAAFIGGALNSTQATALMSRINAYMTALGINVY